ncbi:MAG: glycosyltransferase [Clostridia bacterium]|nr:glycosyltransferase [Clostridia bacterium]
MPKFSIIVPIYKVEKYLTQCLNSILNQSIEDFECILVDDGSPDRCPAICDKYAEADPRFKVVHKENGGLSSARNAGLDIAQGDYIFFVDSDDYLAPDALEKISDCFDTNNSDLVVFNYEAFDESTLLRTHTNFLPLQYDLFGEKERFSFLCRTALQYRIGWEAWDRVYKRSVIEENGLRFYNDKELYAEDLYFNTLYLLHTNKINVLPDRLYFYRLRNDSITGVNNESKIPEFAKLTQLLHDYLSNNQFDYIKKHFYVVFYLILSTPNHIKKNFPALFYLILGNRYRQSTMEQRIADISALDNPKFFENYTKQIYRNHKRIKKHIGYPLSHQEEFDYLHYLNACKRGNAKKISNVTTKIAVFVKRAYFFLLRHVKNALRRIKYIPDKLWRKNVYIFGTEDFGNVGDQLIAVTELAFLKSYYPNYNVIEIPATCYHKTIQDLHIKLKRKDPIILTGGGNMGDMYPFAENIKLDVIKRFPKNKLTIFPQTIYFDNPKNQELSTAQYAKATRLTIATREKYSFKLAKTLYPNAKVVLTPDIVFYRSLQTDAERQNVIRLCLRSDKEKTLSEQAEQTILSSLKDFSVERFDMQLPYNVPVKDRERVIEEILAHYRTAKLIITDRLHGMVVSAVTGTPCIVLPSKSHKMKGTYEWIADLPYIRFANDVNEIPVLLEELLSLPPCEYDPLPFRHYFEQIIQK